ncbi:MAG: TolC family protein [Epsilonproteobacteria bacterium]|nr:TolC family protein [Campylobacterota bacterium]
MKKYILFLLPIFLYSSTFNDLIKSIDNNLLIQSKKEQTKALKKLLLTKKAKNYPFIGIQAKATRLYDTPTAGGFAPTPIIVGTKTNLDISLNITYPLFTGFAITNSIKKAKLQLLKSRLETQELKRELYLKIVTIYSSIFSLNEAIQASYEAKNAIEKSYEKAKGLYKNGFINISNLYKIEAEKYEIFSTIESYKEQRDSLTNDLQYITGIKVNVSFLPNFNLMQNKNRLQKIALNQRADIKALRVELKINKKDIALANSKKYPTITLFAALKRQGDSLRLDGNGFENADQSYIGANLNYNIFDSGEKKDEKQAAIAKRVATKLYFADYKRVIKKNIKNAFLRLKSLKFRAISANKQIKASQSYYNLTNGRFENSLASGDELSRSIADLAKAKAKKQEIKAKIFLQKCKISLLAGSSFFLKKIK